MTDSGNASRTCYRPQALPLFFHSWVRTLLGIIMLVHFFVTGRSGHRSVGQAGIVGDPELYTAGMVILPVSYSLPVTCGWNSLGIGFGLSAAAGIVDSSGGGDQSVLSLLPVPVASVSTNELSNAASVSGLLLPPQAVRVQTIMASTVVMVTSFLIFFLLSCSLFFLIVGTKRNNIYPPR